MPFRFKVFSATWAEFVVGSEGFSPCFFPYPKPNSFKFRYDLDVERFKSILKGLLILEGVQTYVAMVILVAMQCLMRARPFGVKVEFRTSIYVIHHARFQSAR